MSVKRADQIEVGDIIVVRTLMAAPGPLKRTAMKVTRIELSAGRYRIYSGNRNWTFYPNEEVELHERPGH